MNYNRLVHNGFHAVKFFQKYSSIYLTQLRTNTFYPHTFLGIFDTLEIALHCTVRLMSEFLQLNPAFEEAPPGGIYRQTQWVSRAVLVASWLSLEKLLS